MVSSFCGDLLDSLPRLFVGSFCLGFFPSCSASSSSCFFPPSHSFPVSLALPPPPALLPSSVSTAPSSSHFAPSASATLGAEITLADSARDYFDCSAGTSYANFANPYSFHGGDDSSTKGEKDSPALGRSESSWIFHEGKPYRWFLPPCKIVFALFVDGVLSMAQRH